MFFFKKKSQKKKQRKLQFVMEFLQTIQDFHLTTILLILPMYAMKKLVVNQSFHIHVNRDATYFFLKKNH